MNSEYLNLCKKEISSLLDKKLITPSKSPWSCTAFYVNKHSEQERGVPSSPFVEKQVINPVTKQFFQYNYWDYQESFYKTLYYQNPKHSHTWLIKICENIGRNQIPNWFFEWWNNFGTIADILPSEIKNLLEEYSLETSSLKTHNTSNKIICMFFTDSCIPWVIKWRPEFGYTEMHIIQDRIRYISSILWIFYKHR